MLAETWWRYAGALRTLKPRYDFRIDFHAPLSSSASRWKSTLPSIIQFPVKNFSCIRSVESYNLLFIQQRELSAVPAVFWRAPETDPLWKFQRRQEPDRICEQRGESENITGYAIQRTS